MTSIHILAAGLLSLLVLTGCETDKGMDSESPSPDDSASDPDMDGDGSPASEDCDDDDANNTPGSPEICDGQDNDCDGTADNGLASDTWYTDADADGFGDDASATDACEAPDGAVAVGGDCDETDAAIHPDADEVCDAVDNDCDGLTDDEDDDLSGGDAWYTDADGDGYGDTVSATEACEQPAGTVALSGDCDDADVAYNPGATEDDCTDPNDYNCDGSSGYDDADGDGWAACEDCDDAEAGTRPDAVEVCDDIDNDCDGLSDDADDSVTDRDTWYSDGDADGYGDDTTAVESCDAPAETVAVGGDCDDADGAYNPGASEDDCADPNDYNCDGSTGYTDADGDGWAACEDCDDTSATVNEDAVEVCDEIDNDCDGELDEDDAADAGTWYIDTDGDGFGDAEVSTTACVAPEDYVADATDCSDGDVLVNPDAVEVCDGDDNDCDGTADEDDAADAGTWYEDADGDGYGDAESSTLACEAPEGWVSDASDCDDDESASNPGETEICDTLDNDCDGAADEDDADDAGTWYTDGDGDGYGDPDETTVSCEQPVGTVAESGDCDDTTSAANPDQTEVCDGLDNDCDGAADEDSASDAGTWYDDSDGDGYGDADSATVSCEAPAGSVADSGDCDDGDSAVNPEATEVCNEIDDDCDGTSDESDAADAGTWYEDADSDSFGDADSSTVACDAPVGWVEDDTDCDDGDDTINPDETEVCDDLDNDCDGVADEDASDADTWYADTDEDGFGDASATERDCDMPTGYVADDTDCDDGDAAVNSDADEVCDEIDNDCDTWIDDDDFDVESSSMSDWYADSDSDGYGDHGDREQACDAPSGYIADDTDCDDTDEHVNPDATEVCNEIDDDCDKDVDDDDSSLDSATGDTWYADADGDDFGDATDSTLACDAPTDYVADDSDCDDTDEEVNPDATEVCNEIDDDCDGLVDDADSSVDSSTGDIWYADADGDGFGDLETTTETCETPTGYVDDDTDCDDADEEVNPDATEVCNEIDDDCDGLVDDADSSLDESTGSTWYTDDDGDGYGDPDDTTMACEQPTDAVADDSDCDDTDDGTYPGASDTWYDGVDSDCNGLDGPDACDGLPGESSVTSDDTCTYEPAGYADWDVQVEWTNDSADGFAYSAGTGYVEIMATPAVGQLTDDNGDGLIDAWDMPDIAYTTFTSSSYTAVGYLRVMAGDGSGEVMSVYSVSCGGTVYYPQGAGGVAIADVDNDGTPNILVNGRASTASSGGTIIALESDGTCTWASAASTSYGYTMPNVADLDGDGVNEVIAGTYVFNGDDGTTYASGLSYNGGYANYATDIDSDGDMEIVSGSALHDHTGALVWTSGLGNGRTAVADFDGDGQGEIVINKGGTVYMLDADGSTLWSDSIGGTATGNGAPCVGDLDGDGDADVAVAGGSTLHAWTGDGTDLWTMTIRDTSSSGAGCSTFDFDGDGQHEVVYADEYDLFILDGASGTALFTESDHASGTLWEYPIVADVDNDGNAEIVDVSNDYTKSGWEGIHVLGEANDEWTSARNVWNQFAYHITNVADDGHTVPGAIESPWDAGYLQFRGQRHLSDDAQGAPNLTGEIIGVCEDCSVGSIEVYATIANTGAVFAPAGLGIALYAVDGATWTPLDLDVTTDVLLPGVRSAPFTFVVDVADVGVDGLGVIVDDDGFGESAANECDEDDNADTWDALTCAP